MFGRRQRSDDRDGGRWDQADGRSGDFVDPWADQDRNRPPGDDGQWREPDDWSGNGEGNGQRRPGGRGWPAARARAGQPRAARDGPGKGSATPRGMSRDRGALTPRTGRSAGIRRTGRSAGASRAVTSATTSATVPVTGFATIRVTAWPSTRAMAFATMAGRPAGTRPHGRTGGSATPTHGASPSPRYRSLNSSRRPSPRPPRPVAPQAPGPTAGSRFSRFMKTGPRNSTASRNRSPRMSGSASQISWFTSITQCRPCRRSG